MSGPTDAVVVDLGAVGRASAALARWYTDLVATGEGDVDELGQARADLAALPAQPGRLGRAIELVVRGGDDASDAEIVAAVSLLCDAASRAASSASVAPPPFAPSASAPLSARAPGQRRRRSPSVIQPSLPGFDGPAAPGSVDRRP